MPIDPQLQQFVDDELLRAPLLFDETLQGLIELSRNDMALRERGVPPLLTSQQVELASRFISSLRDQVRKDLSSSRKERATPNAALSLVDDEAVLVDVELSRTIETIRSVAEHELRELKTFTSALVGDMHVSRDTNPFRPDVYARALWAALSGLPVPLNLRTALMRHAGPVLAKALRKSYAAACTRLEDQGIEPGTYSTIVLTTGSRSGRAFEPAPLAGLRDSMPMPLDMPTPGGAPLDEVLSREEEMLRRLPQEAGTRTHAHTLISNRVPLLGSAATRADQQVIELLSRLFDAILTDRDASPQMLVLLSRLHAAALRCALRDPATLDSYEHPLWTFIDRMVFVGELHPSQDDPLRAKLLSHVQGLIDNIVREPVQDAQLFRWGLDRLLAVETHLFEQRCRAAAGQIQSLEAMAHHPPAAAHAPLDVGSLHTVPAELMDIDAPSIRSSDALQGLAPAQWVRAFHAGRWRVAQLLWCNAQRSLWLFADATDDSTWALHDTAVQRLHGEGLLKPLRPSSLVQRAAQALLSEFSRR